MRFPDLRLPVSIEPSVSDVMRGVFEIDGWLRYADGALTFEYPAEDEPSGEAVVNVVALPLGAFRDVALKRRGRGAKVVLYPRRLGVLEQVPGASPEALAFRVEAAYRKRAAALVDHLQRVLAEGGGLGVPFQLPDLQWGWKEVRGVLHLDGELLVFEVGVGLPGGAERDRQVIKVEPRVLEEVRFERGLLRDRVCVRPKKPDLLAAMPGTYKEALALSVRKRHRADAERLVYEVERLRRA